MSFRSLNFFPNSGHLLLSSSADTLVKLWDVYHSRELLRDFSGHNKSVTSTHFAPDGRSFISASYDKYVKVWDTEVRVDSIFSDARYTNARSMGNVHPALQRAKFRMWSNTSLRRTEMSS